MRQVNVGIIGTGEIGQLHATNLVSRIPEAKVVAVVDVRREAAERCAKELRIPKIFDDYRAVLDDPEIDAVAICTTPDTHAQIIKEAAAAGKHIFCEKPIGINLEEIKSALLAVKQAGVKLQVGFNRRFDPNFRRAKELIAQGKIGAPYIIHITSRDPEPPPFEYFKVSGGILLDMTIHDFDMARYLIGSEVEEVFAVGATLVDPNIAELGEIDTAVITLRFQSGALGVIDNSCRAVYGYDQRAEVFGEKGMVMVQNPKPDTAVVADKRGYHSPPLLHFFVERYAESYVAEMRAFIRSIIEDEEPPVTGEDGLIAVEIAYAAKKSLEIRRPIRVKEVH